MTGPSWVGHVFNDRYEILELLGQGGMSAVYKANDPNLKRVVAIKLIHAHLSNNPDFLRRFEEEATAVAQLRHPNIVQVFDYNHEDSTYYMVLEFVPGETLQAHLQRLNQSGRRMPAEEAIRYAIDTCEAVDYAHKRGMIHRDIKPANIMLDIHGHAILMDFGIAKMVGSQTHTATGAVVGTAMYMSPEMIQGETPDPRADIYSLGVTLFEAVSGQPPFKADSAMTLMMMHLKDPVPDLHNLVPDVPDILIGVIEKALAKNREDRFASAAEMARALKVALGRIQSGATGTATQAGLAAASAVAPATMPEQRPPSSTYIETTPEAPRVPPPMPSIQTPNTYVESGQYQSPNTYQEQAPSGQYSPNQAGMSQTYAAQPPGGSPPTGTGNYATGGTGPQPAPRRNNRMLLLGGGGIALLAVVCLAIAAIFALPRLFNNGNGSGSLLPGGGSDPTNTVEAVNLPAETSSEQALGGAAASQTQAIELAQANTLPTDTPAPPTATLPPTLTPTPTLSPTPTVPPGIHYVRINNVTIDGDHYVVDYETFEYTEKLPGEHVHFFFNTVSPDQAGVPGNGPWILYGGPRPFTGYKLNAKPAAATEMCALVANPNHSIQLNSGNCFPLPTP